MSGETCKKKDGADSRGLDIKPDMKTFSFSSAIALKRATLPNRKVFKEKPTNITFRTFLVTVSILVLWHL